MNKSKLLGYIAMDIKGPIDKYSKITGKNVNIDNIEKSVEIIKKAKINYEFRTTVVPTLLDKKDFQKIGEWLNGATNYYLQQFRNSKTLDPDLKNIAPYPKEKFLEFAQIMKKYVKNATLPSSFSSPSTSPTKSSTSQSKPNNLLFYVENV